MESLVKPAQLKKSLLLKFSQLEDLLQLTSEQLLEIIRSVRLDQGHTTRGTQHRARVPNVARRRFVNITRAIRFT